MEPKPTRRERRALMAGGSVLAERTCSGGAVVAAAVRDAFGTGRESIVRRIAVGGVILKERPGILGGGGPEGNARVCLTCQLDVDPRSAKRRRGAGASRAGDCGVIPLYETRDPYDRAHAVTTISERLERELVPAGQVAWRRSNSGRPERCAVARPGLSAKPRRYPRSSMLASGVSIDSAFDWLHEARRRLASAGIAGFGGGERVEAWELSKELRLRDIVHGRTRSGGGRGRK
jgi:hypothetical protein